MVNVPALPQGLFFERLAVATLLGLAIGLERQWRQRTAGLHTSTLVAVGAAMFTAVPELAGINDTMRVAAQVVSGVGFLAGGVILRDGFNVRGLITAATLWATAAVGVLAGAGFEVQAAVGAAVIVTVNLIGLPLGIVISRIPHASPEHLATTYTLHVVCNETARSAVRERMLHEIESTLLKLTSMTSSPPTNGTVKIVAEMTKPGRDDGSADRLQRAISGLDGVSSVSWEAAERAT
jgi:putative Mg2+ transporter-C (MgtC) family protein